MIGSKAVRAAGGRMIVLAATTLLVLSAAAAAAVATTGQFFTPDIQYDNAGYDGRFVFNRIRFEPTYWRPGNYEWGLDLGWNHDYPRAEEHFTRILANVTGLDTTTDGSNILALDDPELFRHPWVYLCEVGLWDATDEQAENLRNYMLKGGFVVIDDFTNRAWWNFQE